MQDLLVLSKDTPIARVVGGELVAILPERLPFFLCRTCDVRAWLESRAIDGHRTNSRLLKRALRLEHKDDLTTVLSVNAATITDNYWVTPLGCDLPSYGDIRYKMNAFDKLALTGDVNSFDQPVCRTPELTNIGSFEKCWRLENGEWWMYKAGRNEELFSELLAYRLAKLLDFPIAVYEEAGAFIKSRDFTDDAAVDFEPASGIIGDISDYVKVYELLRALGEDIAGQYVRMCYFDALIYNMDRHENNFGILRDSDTGKVLSFAPFFDHNISIVARGYPSRAPGDMLINDFIVLLRHIGKPFDVRLLSEREISCAVREISFALPVSDAVTDPCAFTVQYLLSRQTAIVRQ